jgi:D-cysteine desulfhydrase
MLGHVNAGLELADQVRRGELPEPESVVLPLGTGGTTAGLALGFTLAGLRTRIVAVRVVPRVAVGRRRVLARARSCARLITRLTGAALPRVTADRVEVRDDWYGGAYGRAVPAAREAAVLLERAAGVRLDDTYSAKAFGAALDLARNRAGPTLFWVTFDPSPMDAVRDAPALAGAAGATP